MLEKLGKHIEKNGAEAVLPQNLTEDLLNFISEEANTFMLGGYSVSCVSCIKFCVLGILCYQKKSGEFEVKIDELERFMALYATAISCEKITRYTYFEIERPTLDNILDENHQFEIPFPFLHRKFW